MVYSTTYLLLDFIFWTCLVSLILIGPVYWAIGREKAREWMSKPHRELSGQTPLEVARTELGARRVEDLLDKLYFGLPV